MKMAVGKRKEDIITPYPVYTRASFFVLSTEQSLALSHQLYPISLARKNKIKETLIHQIIPKQISLVQVSGVPRAHICWQPFKSRAIDNSMLTFQQKANP